MSSTMMKFMRFALAGLALAASTVYAVPPTVTITAPANHDIFVAPAGITINATPAAAGNSVSKVDFYNGASKVGTDITSPYSLARINVAVGDSTIKIDGKIKAEITSSISAVITKPVQGEKLWAGHIDIAGTLVLTTGATFNVYRNNYPCGQNPEFDLDIPATIIGSQFTAAFDWNPFQDLSPVCLRAVAIASDGTISQSVISNIEYQQVTAIVTSPAYNSIVYTPTVVVDVLATVPPGGQVAINGLTATLSGASFEATIPLTLGANEIKATVILNGSIIATSASSYVTYTAPIDRVLTVASPAEGEKRYYSDYDPAKSIITVTGSVTGIAATTVIVKDTFGSMHVADLFGGSFTTNVPVSEQDNWIEVTAYGPGGATAQKRVHFFVTNAATDSIVLTSPTSCTVIPAAPASLTLSALTRSTFPIVRINYLANGAVVGTSTTPPFNVQWNGVGDGSYQISAASYKSDLNSPGGTAEIRVATSAESKITIGAPNVLPTCSLLSPQNGAIYLRNASFPVEATAVDPDGSIARVDFYIDFNLPAGQAPINLYQSFTAPPYQLTIGLSNPGAYSITAKATDNRGGSTFCPAAQIQVSTNTPPSVSLAGPSVGTVFYEGGGAIIEPSVSSNVVKVQLWRGATMLAEQTAAPFTFTLTQLAAGSYTLFARAFDNQGASADSNSITFSVSSFPVVTINAPANGSTYTAPASIPITVVASVPNDTIQRVEISNGGNLLATLTSPPYTYNWTNVPAGNYAITANAFSTSGANLDVARQPRVNVVVNSGVPIDPNAPVVTLTAPLNNTTVGSPVTLTVNAKNIAGTIKTIEFLDGANQIIGYNINIASNNYTLSYPWENVTKGSHTLAAEVVNSFGATLVSATVTITARGAPAVTIITPSTLLVAPATLNLTITATPEPGVTMSRVEIYLTTIGTGPNGTNSAPVLVTTLPNSPYLYSFTGLVTGTYTITARGVDSNGDAGSAALTINAAGAANETITFLHNDLAGSPIAATDATGAVIWKEDYTPYGERKQNEATSTNQHQWFGGKVQDSETGLSYFGARYYDPVVGRFMGVDAVGFNPGNLQSFNRYAYANNNPYKFVDPSGNAPVDWIHGGLTAFSFCPSICGSAFSAMDGAVYAAQGDSAGAAISFGAAAIGIVSDAGVAKVAAMAAKEGAAAMKIGRETSIFAKEGIYEFKEGAQVYVGQSSNIGERLEQHIASGKLAPDAMSSVKTTEVLGGKTAREVAEHKRIREITGGERAKDSAAVSNKKDPIGPNRSELLN